MRLMMGECCPETGPEPRNGPGVYGPLLWLLCASGRRPVKLWNEACRSGFTAMMSKKRRSSGLLSGLPGRLRMFSVTLRRVFRKCSCASRICASIRLSSASAGSSNTNVCVRAS